MPSSSKIHLTIIVNRCKFNSLFNGKLSSVLNLIFIKSLPYPSFLPPFIVSISFLIPSQSSVYFFNTSYFSSAESKTKYLLPFSLQFFFFFFIFFALNAITTQQSCTQYVHLLHQSSDAKDLHYKYFCNHQSFLIVTYPV